MAHSCRRFRSFALAGLVGCCLTALVTPVDAQDTGLFLNILPPGQSGYMTPLEGLDFLNNGTLPEHFDDQRLMYGDLVKSAPGLTDGDLLNYFKAAPIAPGNEAVVVQPPFEAPEKIFITRDDFGVPHVEAKGRKRLMRGIGYASAQDRLLQMDVLRRIGRGQLSAFLGVDPGLIDFALGFDESLYQFAGYDEADLQDQVDMMLAEFGGKAKKVQRDLEEFVNGVNRFVTFVNAQPILRAPAEYVGLDLLPVEPFTVTDVLATATVLVEQFGAGGGGEHRNAILLQKLKTAYGDADGEALYRDLRNQENTETSTTTELSFPYLEPAPVDPAAVALVDVGSIVQTPIVQVTGPLPPPALVASAEARVGRVEQQPRQAMSNFLGIASEHAAGNHPIAVMGPQTGYSIPVTFLEMSIDSSGVRARGAMVPGTPYVVIGRGLNYAWSATSGSSDLIDVRAEKLCEPDMSPPTLMSSHYMFNGECTPMFQRVDTWCAGDAVFCGMNGDNITATVERTVHGIVFARATVDGEPVALSRQRASFKREAVLAVAFAGVNKKSTKKFKKFEKSMRLANATFNWLYVNQDEVAYLHAGTYPIRAAGVDPDLPSWGTGEWEWQGELDSRDKPQEVNPPKGYFTSWNNKPAPDWRAADDNYSYASVHRVDMLDDRLEAAIMDGTPITVAQMVEMMEDAATVDLRGSHVLPHALAIIGAEAGLDPILAILDDWVASGAYRRDRDDDGDYDDTSAVAIMDEWFERMIDAMFGAQLGAFYGDIPMGFDDEPSHGGSSYISGYYGYVEKALREVQGLPVDDPFEILQCADGTLAGCRAALVASLNDTVAELTTVFASADPADWSVDPTEEEIRFSPLGLAAVDPIPWVNRPTFQQVVQVLSKKPF